MPGSDVRVRFDPLKTAGAPPTDLLPLIVRAGILRDDEFHRVRDRVESGLYPHEPAKLAARLIDDQILTEFQARRLLKGKAYGMAVGRYAILDYLGSGSMGRVYRARHLLMDRIVALKVVAPEYLANGRKLARFRREMRLVSRLDHPHVVRALDADQVGKVLFIAMEFVPGRCLDQVLLERGPLPPDEVVELAIQAAEGLHHAHQRGVVHRDVKPSNLLLGDDGRLRLLDFGLSVLMEGQERDSARTQVGIAVGTIDYMSPEQAMGREVDGRSDLYSLGCVIYHLLQGEVMFPGSSVVERLMQRAEGRRVPLKGFRNDLPVPLLDVLERLLAPRAADRYPSAAAAAEALRGLHRCPATLTERPVATPPPDVEVPSAGSSSGPTSSGAPLPLWFRFLYYLAEQPPERVMATAASSLLGAFLVGFILARLFR